MWMLAPAASERSFTPPGDKSVVGEPTANAESVPEPGRALRSASDLFDALWRALADILGTAAAATLLRRAAQLVLRISCARSRTLWAGIYRRSSGAGS